VGRRGRGRQRIAEGLLPETQVNNETILATEKHFFFHSLFQALLGVSGIAGIRNRTDP